MGRSSLKEKKSSEGKVNSVNLKHSTCSCSGHGSEVFEEEEEEDASVFLDMAHNLTEEGYRLFQKGEYQEAVLKYENATKLLPKHHTDMPYLHTKIAACSMEIVPDYNRAIMECNLALEALPKYSKAFLKRARCFEDLNKLDLACKDDNLVLSLEPDNITALEISERVTKAMAKKGISLVGSAVLSLPDAVVVKEKTKRKKKSDQKTEEIVTKRKCIGLKEEPTMAVKLVLGQDIRWAKLPAKCSMLQLREIAGNKFPGLKTYLIKHRDKEGDLITITSSKELMWAEESTDSQGSIKLFLVEGSHEHELCLDEAESRPFSRGQGIIHNSIEENGSSRYDEVIKSSPTCIDDWIVQFLQLFKKNMGSNYENPFELGLKLCSEAIEDTSTSEEAQEIFELAEGNFQEMVALALFNWGNVHVSRARKKLFLLEHVSKESVLEKIMLAYDWAQAEYIMAGKRYKEALRIKPNFCEGLIALAQQQFEQAKLVWYDAIGREVDLKVWPSAKLFGLFDNAQDHIGKGMKMWDEMQEQQFRELFKLREATLEKVGLDGYFQEPSVYAAVKQATNMKAQINILWAIILYKRSLVEFELGMSVWEDCTVASIDKFKLGGLSAVEIAAIVKEHSANEETGEELVSKIDQRAEAWTKIYDAQNWMSGTSSFHLEPLFSRKVQNVNHTLETV